MGKLHRTQRHRRSNDPGQRPAAAARTHDRSFDAASSSNALGESSGTGGLWALRCLQAGLIIAACLWIYSPVCTSDWIWDGRFNQFVHRISPKQGDIPVFRDNGGDWLWDDDQLLTANLTVQHRVSPDPRVPPDHLRSLAKLWFDPDGADYFPLSYTALWAQWPFFGMNSPGYHITTILLHITGSLLLWRLLAIMRIPGAWFASLIFAIHPVCVESVAWVSETKNTLSIVFFMLAAIYYVKADDAMHGVLSGTADDRDGLSESAGDWSELWTPSAYTEALGKGWSRSYVLSLVCFLLAMFAKTSVVAMPVLLLLYAWWKRGRIAAADVVRSAPFFIASLVLGLITIRYQWSRAIGQETILVGGILPRIASSGMSTLFYLWTIVNPQKLLPIYTRWEVDPPKLWQILLPWPIVFGLAAWFWSNRGTSGEPRWGRHALFALGFFLLMVAPVLGFITISYMRITWAADHFIYLPMIGPLALLGAGAAMLFARARDAEKPVYIFAAAAVVAVLAYSSFRYAGVWADEDRLWEYTLSINNEAWQAHNRLGAKKFARGDLDAAHYHFQNSTRLRPDLGETHNNLGTTLSARAQRFAQQGNPDAAKREMDAAIEQFAEATRVTPHVPAIKVNLANALAAAGRFGEAGNNYKQLLEKEPNNPALINNYGVALYKQGLNEAAIKQFRRALEIAPDLKDAKESLAVALGEKPDPAKSAEPPPPPPGGRLNLEPPVSPTLNAAPAIP